MKKNKGFTLAEMVFVLFILSILGYFLFNLFSRASQVTSRGTNMLFVYQDQLNSYTLLCEDIDSSFAKGFENLTNANLRFFRGTNNTLEFIVKKGRHLKISDNNKLFSIDTDYLSSDAGIYRVMYYYDGSVLTRELLVPEVGNKDFSGLWIPHPEMEPMELLIVDTGNIQITDITFSYLRGNTEVAFIDEIPDKVIMSVRIDDSVEGKAYGFRHVIQI